MTRPILAQPTIAPVSLARLLRYAAPLALLWLFLRVLLSFWAALVSVYAPKSAIEHALPLWPPTEPLNLWLERVILQPWLRRDVVHYLAIIERGYRLDDGSAQFHPLYPWVSAFVAGALNISALAGLLLVSSLCGLALLLAFERLALLDLDPGAARWAAVFLALFPVSYVIFAPYTEAMFLLWAVLALYYARQGSWLAAGLVGALAALTRQQGIVLLLPLLWELWVQGRADMRRQQAEDSADLPNTLQLKEQSDSGSPGLAGAEQVRFAVTRPGPANVLRWAIQPSTLRALLCLALIPAGYGLFKLYRSFVLGEMVADFGGVQQLIFSLLISPSSNLVVPVQGIVPPWQALFAAFSVLGGPDGYVTAIDLSFGLLFVLLTALSLRHMRGSYRIYSLAILLLSFSYYTGPVYPYMGLPRHCLLAVPVFLGLPNLLRRPSLHLLYTGLGLFGSLLLTSLYVSEGWVP